MLLAAVDSFSLQGIDKFECVISCRKKGFAVMD